VYAPGYLLAKETEMKGFPRLRLAALLFFAGTAAAAANTQLGTQAMRNWKVGDDCAAEAQKEHPNFTAAENAKRDEALNRCLESHNLPARMPSSPLPH
jgi:hypothetical protein